MAFRIRVEAFREALARVVPIIPSRSLYPITQNLLLYQAGDTVELRATDLEISMRTLLQVLPEDGDAVTLAVPAKPLSDLLKGFPENDVVSVSTEEQQLVVVSPYGRYTFGGVAAEEFPPFPALSGSQGVTLSLNALDEVISMTAFATSRDEARIALTGVYFDFQNTQTYFVATDAHTLVRLRRDDIRLPDSPKLLLPVRALQSLQQAFKGLPAGDELTLHPVEGQALFHHPLLDMVCRLVDARFPDYQSVIPKQPPYTARLSTEGFRRALRRLLVLSDKTSGVIRLSFVGNTLTLQAEDTLNNRSGQETLPCEYEGPDFRIAFRGTVIGGVMDHISSKEFIMQMEAPGRAVVLQPDPQTPPMEALFLAMPLML